MQDNIGKTQTLHCNLDPARAKALHMVLDQPDAAPAAGDALPPFWHQIYFWNTLRERDLGRDGHTAKGAFIPDLGLPRRMWASGELLFRAPVVIGTPAIKTSTIEDVQRKTGESGPLAFCTVRHDISQSGQLCLTERQILVFRKDPTDDMPPAAPPQARTGEESAETHSFSPTTLFRYSALTLNGHRIHYDPVYARETEGYSGIVVHGPLIAQIVMQMAAEKGTMSRFSWRNSAPLIAGEQAAFCAFDDGWEVRGNDGRRIMRASADFYS